MHPRQVNYIYDSLKGSRRTTNKDGILNVVDEQYHILGVFDGVSSAVGAKKAVTFAIKFISTKHRSYFKNGVFNLSRMMENLNNTLCQSNIEEPYTTYSIAYIPNDSTQRVKLSNMGDSRIYSVTKQYLLQLSNDDNDLIHSNVLTKYLGKRELTQSDFCEIEYDGKEQSFLICTDGFYAAMEMSHKILSEIYRILNLKRFYFIKRNINIIIKGSNSDDSSYVFVRWNNV